MSRTQRHASDPPTPRLITLLAGILPASLLRATPTAPTTVAATPSQSSPRLPPPDLQPLDAARLSRWQSASRHPVTNSTDPLLARLLTAASAGESLDVLYYGGTFPGTVRQVTPLVLFTVDGFSGTYLEARCHWRQEVRTFNTARIAFAPLRLA